jgi:hypothetical protein
MENTSTLPYKDVWIQTDIPLEIGSIKCIWIYMIYDVFKPPVFMILTLLWWLWANLKSECEQDWWNGKYFCRWWFMKD